MEETKMKKEKKELVKKFKVVIEDLMDNYEEYTDEEKAQIKDIFELRYDVNNQALVVYEGDFEIHHKTEWRRKALPNGKYFVVVFDNGAERIEAQVPKRMVEENKLSEGRHSDITIVYAEKSQIIVDMWDKTEDSFTS